MAAPSFATAKRSVKSVGTFSVVPMPHVACIAGSRVPIQLHVIRSMFLIDNLDPMSRMVVSRIGGASPKAGGFIGGRAGPLTDVALAEARESSGESRLSVQPMLPLSTWGSLPPIEILGVAACDAQKSCFHSTLVRGGPSHSQDCRASPSSPRRAPRWVRDRARCRPAAWQGARTPRRCRGRRDKCAQRGARSR